MRCYLGALKPRTPAKLHAAFFPHLVGSCSEMGAILAHFERACQPLCGHSQRLFSVVEEVNTIW